MFGTEGESLPIQLIQHALEVVLSVVDCRLKLDVSLGIGIHCYLKFRTKDEVDDSPCVGELCVEAFGVFRVGHVKLTLLVERICKLESGQLLSGIS